VHWAQYSPHGPSSKYYQSEWRRSGSFTGGLLLDGGVHYTAALRLIMGEIESVAAHVTQVSPDLLPADTLTASLRFANGAVGSFLITFGAATPWGAPLTVVGERGSLRVERGRIELAALDGSVQVTECAKLNGVDRELAAFADAVQFGTGHHNTPEEGLRDMAVIEAMLQSATSGTTQSPVLKIVLSPES
jgi:predicted dehydrogenase